ncbi:MAG TPA: YceI family protein [Kofleriaceae bacterium]|nr:YceI family protein [Kofleriaceae bacterium]
MKTIALLFLSTTLALAGCNKTADKPDPGSAAPTTKPKPAPPATDGDRVEVLARHLPAAGSADLASDPVVVHFDKFAVTKASFDPKNLEGGTATIELDPTSIKTGSDERDNDLKSPEFFDVAKFATVTIDVANVKKQADTKYTADATVACHGATKTYAVTFEVLATTADTVRIKGEQAFSRLDFSIGVDPAKDPSERVATALTIQWVLTLNKT